MEEQSVPKQEEIPPKQEEIPPTIFLEEVWENQQLIPIRGFGKPQFTDWTLFSDRFGEIKYNEQFPELTIPEGWEWTLDSQWQVDLSWTETDEEGWVYAKSLNGFKDPDVQPKPKKDKGMGVLMGRRRRWIRPRECATQAARVATKQELERTAAWRTAHQAQLRKKEEWFAEITHYENVRKSQKKIVMAEIRSDVLKAQNKLVKGSMLFEEMVAFLQARSRAEAGYVRGLAELSVIGLARRGPEVEELPPEPKQINPPESHGPPTPPNTDNARPSDFEVTGLRKDSLASVQEGEVLEEGVVSSIPGRSRESSKKGKESFKDPSKSAGATIATLEDAAKKLTDHQNDAMDTSKTSESGALLVPEFIGHDPEVYDAYDQIASLMTAFSTFLKSELVEKVRSLADEYIKVTENFFRTEVADLQSRSQNSERELAVSYSALQRIHSQMCKASAYDVQLLTARLMNGDETMLTKEASTLQRDDVWLQEQKYRRAVLIVNQVLERIADRVAEISDTVDHLEIQKETLINVINKAVVKRQSEMLAKVCTIGYDMLKVSGKIGEGIDATDVNESDEEDEDSEDNIESVPEGSETEEADKKKQYQINIPKVPETFLVILQEVVLVTDLGSATSLHQLPPPQQCMAVLTRDRFLHFFKEDIALPWFGVNPTATFHLRTAEIRLDSTTANSIVLTQTLLTVSFTAKPQKKRMLMTIENNEQFHNWTMAICNPLKDFGAPEISELGSDPSLNEGLTKYSYRADCIVPVDGGHTQTQQGRKGAYLAYLDGINRILGVQVDVIETSEAEQMSLQRSRTASAQAETTAPVEEAATHEELSTIHDIEESLLASVDSNEGETNLEERDLGENKPEEQTQAAENPVIVPDEPSATDPVENQDAEEDEGV